MVEQITAADYAAHRELHRHPASGRAPGELLLVTEFDANVVVWQYGSLDEIVRPNAESTFLAIVLGGGCTGLDVMVLDGVPDDDASVPNPHRVIRGHRCLHVHCRITDLPIFHPRIHQSWTRDRDEGDDAGILLDCRNRQWIHDNGTRLAGVLEAAIAAG